MKKCAVLACASLMAAVMSTGARVAAQQDQAAAALHVVPVRGPVYLVAGAGGNGIVSVGKDGVLMVDTGTAQNAQRLLTTVQQLQTEIAAREEWYEARVTM